MYCAGVTHILIALMPRLTNLQGDSSAEEVANATQLTSALMPISKAKPTVETHAVTDEMKKFSAYTAVRQHRTHKRMSGLAQSRAWKNRDKK